MEGVLIKTGTTTQALQHALEVSHLLNLHRHVLLFNDLVILPFVFLQQLEERQEKLALVEKHTQQLKTSAGAFADNMRAVSQQYRNRSWWEF